MLGLPPVEWRVACPPECYLVCACRSGGPTPRRWHSARTQPSCLSPILQIQRTLAARAAQWIEICILEEVSESK